ncbi:MAG: glycoside hydrolase, partial [Acidobacteriia bacterium]|nr:glycoside hydrolase [Terriglobia bacterium]
AGQANDPFLQVALKSAESLSAEDRTFLLRHSFYSDLQQMIYRYPRYGELFDMLQAQKSTYGPAGNPALFSVQELRDLQMWSQLAWFDEIFQAEDPEVHDWVRRGRNFNLDDQRRMGEKQRELIGKVLPQYRKMAASGQIEISTTPYYHPILPLLCDSNIASVAHPNVPLPPRFRYPQDARLQLTMAHDYIATQFGAAPVGLWPSEGSVSDEVFAIASEVGFRWAATDSGVLNRTLNRGVPVDGLYRPYRWTQGERNMHVIFRDHFLSDLIGFVYMKMNAAQAADDFLRRIRENCADFLASGRDALVPIILDGENAWEYYHRNGRPFLRELYRRITEDPGLSAVTVSEALARFTPEGLDHIFPGSWIEANFDVWIGAEEDNQAWTQLLRARQTFDAAATATPADERRRMAMEELLIAEGSDWCWWYGPEHESANREEFDQLYRSHLANVYRFLELSPPEELSRPILRVNLPEVQIEASGPITPVIDGLVTSYFEWMGAGMYTVDGRSGSMHGKKFLIKEVQYGSDGVNFYIRVDFHPGYEAELSGMEARLTAESPDGKKTSRAAIVFTEGGAHVKEQQFAQPATEPVKSAIECAFSRVLEIRLLLAALGVAEGSGLRFQFSVWQGGLPMDAVPQQGWIRMATTDPKELGR